MEEGEGGGKGGGGKGTKNLIATLIVWAENQVGASGNVDASLILLILSMAVNVAISPEGAMTDNGREGKRRKLCKHM